MAPLFAKRLTCFYCGSRSPQTAKGPVQKFRCNHCEAINYLDEKGEITDPPAAETNPDVYGPGASSPPFEGADFTGSGLFCTQCVRNQHLFTSALASYFPPTDDPNYSAYEREYPKFRQNLEERYPQVCGRCEPLVRERIRQAGYEAKSDHLRRMMDQSKAGRVTRQARNWNWRSLLVFTGALLYWLSIVGQLSWNLWSALGADDALRDPDEEFISQTTLLCIQHALKTRHVPASCAADLAPHAGLALVAGILSLWYNPKLRLKVEGRGGRFAGLSEYYKVQLIVLVVRCAFWAVLRDPSSSGLEPTLPPALHMFMILFTILSVLISRRIVKYDTRPLVNWNEDTPVSSPTRKRDASVGKSTGIPQSSTTAFESLQHNSPRFPLEKLATPRAAPVEPFIPTPPPEGDDMDWTPSVQQREIKPTISVRQRDQPSVLEGPLPFYGSLPAAPKPPSWALRNQSAQRPKHIEQVVERNPFHRTPHQSSSSWGRSSPRADAVFAPPKFFPTSDHAASTGLESLFDKTFTIKTPEDEEEDTRWQSQQRPLGTRTRHPAGLQTFLIFQYLRLGLLLASITAWLLSENGHLSLPGNYIEVASLGSASLIAGFALLETLKHPIAQWNGMEILVYFAELVAAIHLGGNLPRGSFERQYFDRYGKLLLIFMAVQEALTLLSLYRFAANTGGSQVPRSQPGESFGGGSGNAPRAEHHRRSDLQSFGSQPTSPSMSFCSTAAGSSFSTQPPEPQYRLAFPTYDSGLKRDHSFSLTSLKESEPDDYDPLDRDSDTETTVTTATTATNNTIRNIRYGRNMDDIFFSPKRSDLGPGIGGLSLDDRPSRRMTRSQTQRLR